MAFLGLYSNVTSQINRWSRPGVLPLLGLRVECLGFQIHSVGEIKTITTKKKLKLKIRKEKAGFHKRLLIKVKQDFLKMGT